MSTLSTLIRHLRSDSLTVPGLEIHLIPLIVWLSAPVAVVKALISLLHGYIAAINLANIDVAEREALRKQRQQSAPISGDKTD